METFQVRFSGMNTKTCKRVQRSFTIKARDQYDAIDKLGAKLSDTIVFRVYQFGKKQLQMSRTLSRALAGAGPEEN